MRVAGLRSAPTLEAVLRDYRQDTLTKSERSMTNVPVANALGWPAMAVPTNEGPRHVFARPRRDRRSGTRA